MNKLIVVLVLLVFVSVFAVMNAASVSVNFFFIKMNISLALVIFVSALIGAIIVFLISLFDKFKKLKETDKIKKKLRECEAELAKLKVENVEKENNEIIQKQME